MTLVFKSEHTGSSLLIVVVELCIFPLLSY